jgi:hypothetical protein
VKYSVGAAIPKQCRANNPKFSFFFMLSLMYNQLIFWE